MWWTANWQQSLYVISRTKNGCYCWYRSYNSKVKFDKLSRALKIFKISDLKTNGLWGRLTCNGLFTLYGTGTGNRTESKRNVHTGRDRERNQNALFPVVLVQFPLPVPVPFPCSVVKPFVSLQCIAVFPEIGLHETSNWRRHFITYWSRACPVFVKWGCWVEYPTAVHIQHFHRPGTRGE